MGSIWSLESITYSSLSSPIKPSWASSCSLKSSRFNCSGWSSILPLANSTMSPVSPEILTEDCLMRRMKVNERTKSIGWMASFSSIFKTRVEKLRIDPLAFPISWPNSATAYPSSTSLLSCSFAFFKETTVFSSCSLESSISWKLRASSSWDVWKRSQSSLSIIIRRSMPERIRSEVLISNSPSSCSLR